MSVNRGGIDNSPPAWYCGGMGTNAKFNDKLASQAAVRRERMAEMRAQGKTIPEIRKAFGGISRQRVYAILAGGKK